MTEGRNPRDIKVLLAQEIVARFHSAAAANEALAEFESRFKDGVLPDDMPELKVRAPLAESGDRTGAGIPVAQLAKLAGVVASTSEALRLIAQGGLRIDGDAVTDKGRVIPRGATVVVQAGKRKFARVTII